MRHLLLLFARAGGSAQVPPRATVLISQRSCDTRVWSHKSWAKRAFQTTAPQSVSPGAAQHSEPAPAQQHSQQRGSDAPQGPLALYRQRREAGLYRPDPRQEITVGLLQDLWESLHGGASSRPRKSRHMPVSGLTMVDSVQAGPRSTHHGGAHGAPHKHAGPRPHSASNKHVGSSGGSASGGGFWSGVTGFFGGSSSGSGGGSPMGSASSSTGAAPMHPGPHLPGLYMYGGVGCGKTMLMDVFVHTATPEMQVVRTHFHDFMLGVHNKLRKYAGDKDPLLRVADSIAKGAHVLALDEFFVTDVADAMILSRLFGRLWDRNVVLVATSNRHPDKLYEGGLQRAVFLPFIARLKTECISHDMASTTDYRKMAHYQRGLYFTAKDKEEDLREEWIDCTEGAPLQPVSLDVMMGRTLRVEDAAGGCAKLSFDELCGRPVAAADYLAIAEKFHTLAVCGGVPIFTGANKSAAYRFVTLIDVMYEHRVRMLLSADGTPFELFHNIRTQADLAKEPSLRDDPDIVVDDNLGFAKDRTISRLLEMQSLEYLIAHAKQHAPQNLLALEEAQRKAPAVPPVDTTQGTADGETAGPSKAEKRTTTTAAKPSTKRKRT